MSQTWSQDERDLARRLFVAHNKANGALYPDGFGFLAPKDMEPWLQLARVQITASSGVIK